MSLWRPTASVSLSQALLRLRSRAQCSWLSTRSTRRCVGAAVQPGVGWASAVPRSTWRLLLGILLRALPLHLPLQLTEVISDAIRDADLNLNPQVEGNTIRVPVPKPSKETREATAKLVSKIAETAKNRVRRVRQAAMDKIKKVEGASPDDTFREMKEIDGMTAAATAEITGAADRKRKEVEATG